MQDECYGFIRFYERLEYAQDFRRGRLRMRSLQYYREYRDEAGEFRGDRLEGVSRIIQPNSVTTLKVDGQDLDPSHLNGRMLMFGSGLERWLLFCMYSITTGGFYRTGNSTSLQELKAVMQLHDKCFGLGNYVVVVHNGDAFIKQVKVAAAKVAIGGAMAFVNYYDAAEYNGEIPEMEIPFWKRMEFAHQKEFRIALSPENFSDPFVLDVGDVTDITSLIPTRELNGGQDFQSHFGHLEPFR
jgi:hypothetical protein